jgi:glycerol-3-phosphate dehydrogenase
MTQALQTDIVILGGGIAGLWLLNSLRQQGYGVILIEKHALGSGQTLASQGIIHGGLKYALSGVLSPASSAIAAMPSRWRKCLNGESDVDLRACKVLAPHYFMWSSGGYRSRLKTFLGSKALRGRIDALSPSAYPDFLREQSLSGTLYQLDDFVVDTPSLVKVLAEPHHDCIFQIAEERVRLLPSPNGGVASLQLETAEGPLTLRTQRLILCAGEGNAALLTQLDLDQPQMQTRPLHMLAMRTRHPHPVFLHCIGDSFGMTPRLTITSHPCGDGQWDWYIGGEIAESGVERSATEQIAEGRRQLAEVFPWVAYDEAKWTSFYINRAEPKLPNLQRPDTAFVQQIANTLIAWPTKLTLTPELGSNIARLCKEQGLRPQDQATYTQTVASLASRFPRAPIANPRWEDLFA